MQIFDRWEVLRARDGSKQRVTPLELCFDLVHVFAGPCLTPPAGCPCTELTAEGLRKAALGELGGGVGVRVRGTHEPEA